MRFLHSTARFSAAIVLMAGSASAQTGDRTIQFPRGTGITIDARFDEPGWATALRIESPPGTIVRLMRDDSHVYVGITSSREGFASLCVATGPAIHILHASAALGAITYHRDGALWNSRDTTFRYGMRNTATDDATRAERERYLAEHGWVASTVRMGDGMAQEMKIALDRFALPFALAMGRFLMPNGVEAWPQGIPAGDGCIVPRLVQGYVPRGLTFDPTTWLQVAR